MLLQPVVAVGVAKIIPIWVVVAEEDWLAPREPSACMLILDTGAINWPAAAPATAEVVTIAQVAVYTREARDASTRMAAAAAAVTTVVQVAVTAGAPTARVVEA